MTKKTKLQIQIKIDAALPGGRDWALKVQKILSRMLYTADEWLLFPDVVRNFIPIFDTREVKTFFAYCNLPLGIFRSL